MTAAVLVNWQAAWPRALACWSKYTRLRSPQWCLEEKAARAEGLEGSFAMIRLHDQAVVVNLEAVVARGLEDYAVEILAHEIGHHVLAPANLTDHLRSLARIRWALPTVEAYAPLVANLYTDLLINDRLQRAQSLRLADVYRKLRTESDKSESAVRKGGRSNGTVWRLYLRIYEVLWSLERGSLGGGATDDRLEGDAWLGARLVRSYANDWLKGSGRFAALLLPHLLDDQKAEAAMAGWHDTRGAGTGSEPSGAVEQDADERESPHPATEADLSGDEAGAEAPSKHRMSKPRVEVSASPHERARGQAREPFEYGAILKSAGLNLTDHEVAVRYYRERARPQLIPFPSRRRPEGTDPLPEGLDPWDFGHSLEQVDWLQSVLVSPHVIPGLTTVQRAWGVAEGAWPSRVPMDLDLYVDSSGSMPNPQQRVSYLALAGAILSLSALRSGGRVQVTLWSGQRQFLVTPGFCRDETAILRVLTGFFGGGTQFPLHLLRETYAQRPAGNRPVHLMVISDDGVSTLFDSPDEKGRSGKLIAADALARAGGGGTLVLNLPLAWEAHARRLPAGSPLAEVLWAREHQGWNVHPVSNWEDLVRFAREFSQRMFAEERGGAGRSAPRSAMAGRSSSEPGGGQS